MKKISLFSKILKNIKNLISSFKPFFHGFKHFNIKNVDNYDFTYLPQNIYDHLYLDICHPDKIFNKLPCSKYCSSYSLTILDSQLNF